MADKLLRVLNMPHVSQWDQVKHLPRFLQPLDFSLSPCVYCPGNCCMSVVGVTLVEGLRLALHLVLPLEEVVQLDPVVPGERPPALTPPIPVSGGPVTLRLRHTPGHACVFLHSFHGRGRCAAHALRPGICRVFPYEVQWGRRRVSVGSQTLCPVRWLTDAPAESALRRDLRRWDADLVLERKILAGWQAETPDRSWGSLLGYAAPRLAQRWKLDLKRVLDPPRRRLGRALWTSPTPGQPGDPPSPEPGGPSSIPPSDPIESKEPKHS